MHTHIFYFSHTALAGLELSTQLRMTLYDLVFLFKLKANLIEIMNDSISMIEWGCLCHSGGQRPTLESFLSLHFYMDFRNGTQATRLSHQEL